LGVLAAENIALAVCEENAKVGRARRVPAIFDLGDVHHPVGNLQSEWTLISLESGIAFDAHDGSPDGSPASAAFGEFRVPGGAQENDDGG